MSTPLIPGRPESAPEHIGARLKLFRLAKNMKVRPFATRIGVDHSALSKVERGERQVSKEMLLSLYGAFEASADFILFGVRRGLDPELRERIEVLERSAADSSLDIGTPDLSE
jgi:transcriptional regulator with XRE-family HTH domain